MLPYLASLDLALSHLPWCLFMVGKRDVGFVQGSAAQKSTAQQQVENRQNSGHQNQH